MSVLLNTKSPARRDVHAIVHDSSTPTQYLSGQGQYLSRQGPARPPRGQNCIHSQLGPHELPALPAPSSHAMPGLGRASQPGKFSPSRAVPARRDRYVNALSDPGITAPEAHRDRAVRIAWQSLPSRSRPAGRARCLRVREVVKFLHRFGTEAESFSRSGQELFRYSESGWGRAG
jgi:hypothetical protein